MNVLNAEKLAYLSMLSVKKRKLLLLKYHIYFSVIDYYKLICICGLLLI